MKKLMALFIVLVCVVGLVACGEKEPTTSDTPNATIPSIMYEGNLYRITEDQIAVEVDETAIVGNISSVVPLSQFPANDSEANFGQVGDPYALIEDGLVVLVNDEWTLFELFTEE